MTESNEYNTLTIIFLLTGIGMWFISCLIMIKFNLLIIPFLCLLSSLSCVYTSYYVYRIKNKNIDKE